MSTVRRRNVAAEEPEEPKNIYEKIKSFDAFTKVNMIHVTCCKKYINSALSLTLISVYLLCDSLI